MSKEASEPRSRKADHDRQYLEATAQFGPAPKRLAVACEGGPDVSGDLLQDIHLAIWRSFATFDNQCSLKTWVYRVAHNTAASHVLRRTRLKAQGDRRRAQELDRV